MTRQYKSRDTVMLHEYAAPVYQAGSTATAIIGRMGARSQHACSNWPSAAKSFCKAPKVSRIKRSLWS